MSCRRKREEGRNGTKNFWDRAGIESPKQLHIYIFFAHRVPVARGPQGTLSPRPVFQAALIGGLGLCPFISSRSPRPTPCRYPGKKRTCRGKRAVLLASGRPRHHSCRQLSRTTALWSQIKCSAGSPSPCSRSGCCPPPRTEWTRTRRRY